MLIENTQPCHRSIGDLHLQPGCNTVDPKKWEQLQERGYKKPLAGLLEEGILVVHESEKPTMSIVAATYDVDLLETWFSEAKGPLKGAIKKQLAKLIPEKKAS